jgi:hypothetical protein
MEQVIKMKREEDIRNRKGGAGAGCISIDSGCEGSRQVSE